MAKKQPHVGFEKKRKKNGATATTATTKAAYNNACTFIFIIINDNINDYDNYLSTSGHYLNYSLPRQCTP